MLRFLSVAVLLSACTGNFNPDVHCLYVTGQKNELEFCPSDPNAVGDKRLNLTLGKADEIILDNTAQTGGVSYATTTSNSDAVATSGSESNAFVMIPNALGDATVSVMDASGNELDRVAVHVGKCDGRLGEYGKAIFCGDSDSKGHLAAVVNGYTRFTVFTPSYGRLDFTSASESDSAKATVTASQYCDKQFDYCTNVFDVVGVATGTVDIGVSDANGEIDQLTIDVIDHW